MYLSRLLLAIWFVGVVGTAAELLLLEHFDGVRQIIPLALLASGMVVGAWYGRRPTDRALRAFRGVLVLFLVAAAVGIYLHYSGNVEFEVEQDPAIGGLRLVWEALTGATPALAPGSMALLGLIGYAATVARGVAGPGLARPGRPDSRPGPLSP